MRRFSCLAVAAAVLGLTMMASSAQAQAATLSVSPGCVNDPATDTFYLSGSGATPNSAFDVDIYSNNTPGYHTTIAESNTDSSGAFSNVPDLSAEFVTYGSYYPPDGSNYTLVLLTSVGGNLVQEGTTTIQLGNCAVLPAFTDQFLQPLTEATDPANPMINTGKNGRVIPVKVQISQGATAITDQNSPGPVTIAVSRLASCSSTAGSDPIASYADAGQSSAGTNQFRYDTASQAWTYNLDTKALGLITGNCYRIDVSVDGTQIANAFAVFQPTK